MQLIKRSSFLIYWAVILSSAIFFLKRNNCNWDIAAYTACIFQLEHLKASAEEIHSNTYAILQKEISEDAFNKIVDSSIKYRKRTYADAAYFNEQLCFYKVKPGYNALNFLFKKITGSYTKAIALTSVIGWLLTALLIPLWLKKHLPKLWVFPLALFILFLPFIVESARTATPDLLSAAVLLWSYYSLFRGKPLPSMILAVLSIFLRPDNNLVAVILIAFIWLEFAIHSVRVQAIGAMLATAVITFWLLPICGGMRNVEALYSGGYLTHIWAGARTINESFLPLIFVFTCILFMGGVLSIEDRKGRLSILFLVIAIVKFFVVPSLENRFFIPFIIAMLILSAIAMAEYRQRVKE